MMKQKEIEEIKKLIQCGFDIELISFELDIPIEQVIQCKADLESSRADYLTRTTYSAGEIVDKSNNAYSIISQMREKYKQLYFRSNKVEVTKTKQLSQKDIELIKTVITAIEEKIRKIKTLPRKEKKYVASGIFSELKKIEEYKLPIAQAEQLYMLMCSEELNRLNTNVADRIDYQMENQRRKCASKYAKSIEFEQYEVDDIEELKKLERKITLELVNENPIVIGTVKSKISSRILAIQQQNAIERIRNNVPTSIISIIQDLASGNIDIQKANEIIDEEVKRRVESKTKTRFGLTAEQEKRQILTQIGTVITEKADRFPIQEPESTILQIQKLCGFELAQSIRVVVKNLIERKDFETARSICDKFSKNSKDEIIESEYTKYIRGLRSQIRNAEISDIVMKAINMNGTPEEESAYISLIEKGLKMGNVNLRAISLGRSKDGLKSITLADIWCDENQKYK